MSWDLPQCTEISGLLQPYVDDELGEPERERVGEHVNSCSTCRHAVQEQQRVRATLRALPADQAPASLRLSIVDAMDRIDHTEQEPSNEQGKVVRFSAFGRIRAFGRGGLLAAPAAAAALALFFVARADAPSIQTLATAEPAAEPISRIGADAPSLPTPSGDEGTFPTQLHRSPGIDLVSNAGNADGATVHYRDAQGRRIVDLQRRASGQRPQGRAQIYRDQVYYMGTDAQGNRRIEFVVGEVHHSLRWSDPLAGSAAAPGQLLDRAHALRSLKTRLPAGP